MLAGDPWEWIPTIKARSAAGQVPPRTFFEQTDADGVVLIFCAVQGCSKALGYKYGIPTGMLIAHLDVVHRTLWEENPSARDGERRKATVRGPPITVSIDVLRPRRSFGSER